MFIPKRYMDQVDNISLTLGDKKIIRNTNTSIK